MWTRILLVYVYIFFLCTLFFFSFMCIFKFHNFMFYIIQVYNLKWTFLQAKMALSGHVQRVYMPQALKFPPLSPPLPLPFSNFPPRNPLKNHDDLFSFPSILHSLFPPCPLFIWSWWHKKPFSHLFPPTKEHYVLQKSFQGLYHY